MYEYKKRPSKIKKIITLIILILTVAATSIFIYDMYINIDVYSNEEEQSSSQAIRLSYEENNNEIEKQSITNMLESIIESVVGISKIKNSGSSIFLNNSTYNLGLRNRNNCFRKWIYTYKLACSRR